MSNIYNFPLSRRFDPSDRLTVKSRDKRVVLVMLSAFANPKITVLAAERGKQEDAAC